MTPAGERLRLAVQLEQARQIARENAAAGKSTVIDRLTVAAAEANWDAVLIRDTAIHDGAR